MSGNSDDELTVYAVDKRAVLATHDREFSKRRRANVIGQHLWLDRFEPDAPELLEAHVPEVVRQLRFVEARQNWGEDWVVLHDEDGVVFSLSTGWTDAGAVDPFVVVAAGRCPFTMVGLPGRDAAAREATPWAIGRLRRARPGGLPSIWGTPTAEPDLTVLQRIRCRQPQASDHATPQRLAFAPAPPLLSRTERPLTALVRGMIPDSPPSASPTIAVAQYGGWLRILR